MSMFKHIKLILIISLLFLTSCSGKKINSISDFERFINDPQNGFVHTKTINGYMLQLKLIPSELLAWKEFANDQNNDFEALKNDYSNGFNFTLSISPDGENRKHDLILSDVKTYEEYREKFTDLAFHLKDHLSLKLGNYQLAPRIAMMEPVYQLKPGRDFNIVFAAADEKELNAIQALDVLDIVFEDDFFDTGTSHFIFKKEKIKNIPPINNLSYDHES